MLSKSLIEKILNEALSTGGDFAEIFIEKKNNNSFFMIDGKLESTVSGRDFGIGIRIFKGLFSVYGFTNDMEEENLLKTTKKIAQAVKGTKEDITLNLIKQDIENINKIQIFPETVSKNEKIDLMKIACNSAKNYDSIISQVRVSYADVKQNILIVNSEGRFVTDERVRGRISIESIAEANGEMQTGRISPGASSGFEFFKNLDIENISCESSRIAKTMLNASYCPSGKIPVILDNGFGGVIFHEACGHSLEASSVSKGNSIFANKMGKLIANPLVSAVDDGTIPNEWGSITIDDEGTPSQRNLLIENGILKGYMIDKLNGRRMNKKSTGSGRRESYKYAPTSRMTNTFILPGKSSFNDIIRNTEKGIYAKYMGGGSVNPTTGDFNFAVMEGYIIENGEIKEPVRGATLIGNGGEVLKKIDMVGNNLSYGQGMCGASSGSIPTNVGQPTIRISEITVGGRK
ncbi:MAG: TldD/PmbA family protein [Fusobacterium perfoetens]|uniref:TldD/PmbA family protein n=1 Tax=Fusobacterium perfoetens TaxID=852 RepID=UPI0023F3DE41|nr:TldD/PmbA family protein [Fusobacterium perfoetens]MCI6153463.1 TldD/PmbA family protein [Fusobacterium perfoetens]MDY3238394.1 TldD/PmbA family protein [Fusobacterium perfoetens]